MAQAFQYHQLAAFNRLFEERGISQWNQTITTTLNNQSRYVELGQSRHIAAQVTVLAEALT